MDLGPSRSRSTGMNRSDRATSPLRTDSPRRFGKWTGTSREAHHRAHGTRAARGNSVLIAAPRRGVQPSSVRQPKMRSGGPAKPSPFNSATCPMPTKRRRSSWTDVIHINPLLYLFGFRVSDVVLEGGQQYLVITRRNLEDRHGRIARESRLSLIR